MRQMLLGFYVGWKSGSPFLRKLFLMRKWPGQNVILPKLSYSIVFFCYTNEPARLYSSPVVSNLQLNLFFFFFPPHLLVMIISNIRTIFCSLNSSDCQSLQLCLNGTWDSCSSTITFSYLDSLPVLTLKFSFFAVTIFSGHLKFWVSNSFYWHIDLDLLLKL